MYITSKRRDVELDRASIKLELPDFLKLYDPVIETPVLETAVGDDRECGLLVPHRRSQSIVLR